MKDISREIINGSLRLSRRKPLDSLIGGIGGPVSERERRRQERIDAECGYLRRLGLTAGPDGIRHIATELVDARTAAFELREEIREMGRRIEKIERGE